MTVTLIGAVSTYIKTYSGLKSGAPVWVGFLGNRPTEYAVVPLPGPRIVETYLDGGTLREFPFAFQSMESTADDLERLEKVGFYEAFAAWMDAQTLAGMFPTLNAGQTPEKIEATGWASLFEQGQSDTGIYLVQCKMTYEQSA